MSMLLLKIHCPGSEPYRIHDELDLHDAIRAEASTIAAGAGSELLESPSEACRAKLRERVIREMRGTLRDPGDRYRDPTGVLYTLVETEEEPRLARN